MPLERLRLHLASSRAAGRAFDAAWAAARREVRDREWKAVLDETREAWEAAYIGAPAPSAIGALRAVAHDDERETVADARGICEECGALIPMTRQRSAVFCGDPCRKRAANRRAPARLVAA
jgi:hypothetical protein